MVQIIVAGGDAMATGLRKGDPARDPAEQEQRVSVITEREDKEFLEVWW